MTPEFTHVVAADTVGGTPRALTIGASPAERVALAARFDLLSLDAFEAALSVWRDGDAIRVAGRVTARGFQPCGLSGAPVNFAVDEPVAVRFATLAVDGDDVELSDADLDTLPLDDDGIDLGEVAAQSLGLALDPYPRAPDADAGGAVLAEADFAPAARPNPFAVLKRG